MRTENLRSVTLDSIIELSIYPLANLLPMLEKNSSDEEKKTTISLAELADSIRYNGLQDPIVLFRGSDEVTMILDGRNRRLASKMAAETDKVPLDKYEIQVLDFVGSENEADEFVFAKGFDRRDVTKQQRAIAAAMFEYQHPEKFNYMKSLAEGAMVSQLTQNRDTAEPNLAQREERAFDVNNMLANKFHVSAGYVKDARRKFREEKQAREDAERHSLEAVRLEVAVKEAAIEIEEAKAEGDSAKIWEISQKQNTAVQAAFDEREKAAAKAEQASKVASEIEKIRTKQGNLRTPSKEQKEASDDPIRQLRQRLNSAFTNIKQSVSELAKISGQGVDDYNFVGRRVSEMIEHFEECFGISE